MRRMTLVLVLAAACSAPRPLPPPDGGIVHVTGLANNHVPSCTDPSMCGSGAEPPVGGPHCPSWLPCRIHSTAQNRCEWIHNLEHGHMVLAYNCPSGCPELVQVLSDFQVRTPRTLVTPDPLLKTKVAAIVWGYSWSGETLDADTLEAVRAYQDADAPEAGLGCAR